MSQAPSTTLGALWQPRGPHLDARVLREAHDAAGVPVRAPRPHRAQVSEHAGVAVTCDAGKRRIQQRGCINTAPAMQRQGGSDGGDRTRAQARGCRAAQRRSQSSWGSEGQRCTSPSSRAIGGERRPEPPSHTHRHTPNTTAERAA